MYFTSVKQKRTYPFYMVQLFFIYVLILIYITSIKKRTYIEWQGPTISVIEQKSYTEEEKPTKYT